MKTLIVAHFGGVQGTPPGSEKDVKIYTKMPAGPQNGVPENGPKNAAEKAAVRCRTCPTGGFQKGRCRFRREINGWPKTGSRCSCAPTPQKAPSRVVLVMFLVCFEVWLGRTAADKPSCAAPQRRLGYTFCWRAQTRPDPSKSNSFSLCCDCGCIFSETIFKCVPVATPRKRVVPVWCLLQPHIK